MLDELPELAKRLKVFVRENPSEDRPWSFAEEDQRQGFAALTAAQLVKAAVVCRHRLTFPVMNDSLSLAELRSYEKRVNTVPLGNLPGSGAGLVRVLGFEMGQDDIRMGPRSPGRIWACLEYSPLGWPDLPDMAEADLNVLFPAANIDDLPADAPVETMSVADLRRQWGFP